MDNSEISSLPNASFLRRITAGLYDLFLLFAVAFLYTMVVTVVANSLGYEPSGLVLEDAGENMRLSANEDYQPMLNGPLYQLGLYLTLLAFYIGFWRTRSATLGMQTWRLRLIDLDGNRPRWKQLIVRALAGTASLIFFGLGFVYSLIDKQNRTLHDIVSSTRVVVTPKTSN